MPIQLQSAEWAKEVEGGLLEIDCSARNIQMCNSDGTGDPLVYHGKFGSDIIHFSAGEGVPAHTHEGAHILFVLAGNGELTFDGSKYDLFPGLCYLVPGGVDHAIDANSDLILIVVGDDHHPLDCKNRMTPTE